MFKPTFRQLQVFEAVANGSSFSKAANELHLSQPAVSIQIKQLEQQAGFKLFEHIGKKIQLTYPGKILLESSKKLSSELNEAGQKLEELKGLKTGHLELAVVTTANAFSTKLLAQFIRIHPKVTFSLTVTNRHELIEMIDQGQSDLIIMGLPPDTLEVKAEKFMQNPLVIIANKEHKLTKEKNIPFARLLDESFVLREEGSGTRHALNRMFQAENAVLEPKLEFSSSETIKEAVQAGLGLALVSQHTIKMELKSGVIKILDIKGMPLIRHWHLVVPRGKNLSPMAKRFKEFILEKAPKL